MVSQGSPLAVTLTAVHMTNSLFGSRLTTERSTPLLKSGSFVCPLACVFSIIHYLPFSTHIIKFSRINTLHELQPLVIRHQSHCPGLCPHTQTSTGKSYDVVPLSPIFTLSSICSSIGNGYALCPTFQPLPLPASHLLVLLLLSEVLLEVHPS